MFVCPLNSVSTYHCESAWPKGQKMAMQWSAYLFNLSFVKMERACQRSLRMTEFRRLAVAFVHYPNVCSDKCK